MEKVHLNNMKKTTKKNLTLAEQAIIDAKAIVQATETNVKYTILQSINKKVTKSLKEQFNPEMDDDDEEQVTTDNMDDQVIVDDVPSQDVESSDFLNDYITPETNDEEDQVTTEEVGEEEDSADELMFDDDGTQVPESPEEFEEDDEDEQLNAEQIEEMVNKLRQGTDEEEYQEEVEQPIEEQVYDDVNAPTTEPVTPEVPQDASTPEQDDDRINQYAIQNKKLKLANKKLTNQNKIISKQLDQATSYIAVIKKNLQQSKEQNLRAACIANLLKRFDISEANRTKIIKSFDNAKNQNNIKMTYQSYNVALKNMKNDTTKKVIKQNFNSSPVGNTKPKQIINEDVDRMRELAGI